MVLSNSNITLYLAQFLDKVALVRLRLVNRSLAALLLSRLFRTMTLSGKQWAWYPGDADGRARNQQAWQKVHDLLRLDLAVLARIKHLRILNHERWMTSRAMEFKLADLVDLLDLQHLEIAQGAPAATFPTHCINDFPKNIRSLTLDSVSNTSDMEHNPFPPELFGNPQTLTLIDLDIRVFRKLYSSVKAFLEQPDHPPLALRYLRLDLFVFSMASILPFQHKPEVHTSDMRKFLHLVSVAPNRTHVEIGSTPTFVTSNFTVIPPRISVIGQQMSEDNWRGIDGQPFEPSDSHDNLVQLMYLAHNIKHNLRQLESLTLFYGSRGRGYHRPDTKDRNNEQGLVIVNLMENLKHFKTNLVYSDSAYHSGLESAARLVCASLPKLDSFTFASALPHPLEAYEPMSKRSQVLRARTVQGWLSWLVPMYEFEEL
ncbi:hypothetical protein JCM8547_001683 [Rhodosporidiobolus lusitaniae]